MEDNEIIKALECCLCSDEYGRHNCCKCSIECGIFKTEDDCIPTLRNAVIDLINRQKSEIEILKIELQAMRNAANGFKRQYNEAKSEAVKEFAERLKEATTIYVNAIDNLVKEMTEGLCNG